MNETPSEKAKRIGVPLIPARPFVPLNENTRTVAVCGECGREIKAAEGYACGRDQCPARPRYVFEASK